MKCLCFLPLCLLASATPLWSAPKEAPTFELKAVKIGLPDFPQLYGFRKGADGKPERFVLEVPEQMVGASLRLPVGVPIKLYAAKDGVDAAEGSAPFVEFSGAGADAQQLLLFHPDEKGAPRHDILESSLKEHPTATVRMVNLSGKRVAFSVGGTPVPVAPGASATLRPNPDERGRFPFQYFEERAGEQPYRSPNTNFRFRVPDHRMLVVFANAREESQANSDDPEAKPEVSYRPQALFVFDRTGEAGVPASPAASGASPQASADSGVVKLAASAASVSPTPSSVRVELLHMSRGCELILRSGAKTSKLALKAGEIAVADPGVGGDIALATDPSQPVAKLQPGTSSGLVVLVDGESEGSTRSAVFDDSQQSHPAGQLRVFNMTPYQLAYSGGEEGIAYIDPLGYHVVSGNGGVLKLAAKAPGGWKLVSSDKEEPVLPGTRGYLFVRKVPGADEFAMLRKSR